MQVEVTARAADQREGFTIAELRAFLARCQLHEVPDGAYVRARQTKAFNGAGGRLTKLTVDLGD